MTPIKHTVAHHFGSAEQEFDSGPAGDVDIHRPRNFIFHRAICRLHRFSHLLSRDLVRGL